MITTTLFTVKFCFQAIVYSTYSQKMPKLRHFSCSAQNKATQTNYDYVVIYFDLFYRVVVIFVRVQSSVTLIFHFKVGLMKNEVYDAHTYWCTQRLPFAI